MEKLAVYSCTNLYRRRCLNLLRHPVWFVVVTAGCCSRHPRENISQLKKNKVYKKHTKELHNINTQRLNTSTHTMLFFLLSCAAVTVSALPTEIHGVSLLYSDFALSLEFQMPMGARFQQMFRVVENADYNISDVISGEMRARVKPRTFITSDHANSVTVLNVAQQRIEGLITVADVLYQFQHNASRTVLTPAAEFYDTTLECGAKTTINGGRQRSLRLANLWNPCFIPNPVSYKIGLLLDFKMFEYLETQGIEPEIYADQMVSQANVIYVPQLNFQIHISQFLAVRNASLPFFFSTCQSESGLIDPMTKQLIKMAEFQTSFDIKTVGYWHEFTGCEFTSKVAGLAYLDTMCTHPFNVGVSNGKLDASWWVFAHELGHHIGAQHTFENGIGETGGLMDVRPVPLNGIWQFNTPYSRVPVCNHIQRHIDEKCNFITSRIPIRPVIDPFPDDSDSNDDWLYVVLVCVPAAIIFAFGLWVVFKQRAQYKAVSTK